MGQRLLAQAMMVLAVLCGAGSLILFAAFPLGSFGTVRLAWPEPARLAWDAILSLAFFTQHSGMVRRSFRAWSSTVIPPACHRAAYSIASGLALTAVVVLWQRSAHHVYALEGPLRWLARASAILAAALFVWGASAIHALDIFGLSAIRSRLRGSSAEPSPEFIVRGPYRWVRHPWYLGAILLFWSSADTTADRLLFNVLWTAWIILGARWEEADLLADFGEAYRQYRRRVPMLLPWRRPV